MVFQKVLSTNSDESNWNQVNDLATEVRSKDVTQIFKDDTGTRRVLLGKGADGFYGLKVSPPGVDVYTATDAQLVFNSDQNIFKIVASDTGTVTTSGHGNFTTVIPHGLSFTPALIAYANYPSGSATAYNPVPLILYNAVGGADTQLEPAITATVIVDDVNVTLFVAKITSASFDGDYTFKYYLLQETAN